VLNKRFLPALEEALRTCESVELLTGELASQGMLGHLHRLVVADKAIVADPVLSARIAELQRAAEIRSLRQTSLLLRVLDGLRQAGIAAMPYKGPAWAMSLYGDVAMRTWSDLDLLVHHADVSGAREVLLREGFIDGNPYNAKIAGRKTGSLGQIALSHPAAQAHLELHWEVTVGISSRSLRPEAIFARAEELELLGRTVLHPSRGDRFLITCIEYSRDRWGTAEKLLSLAVQIRQVEPSYWPSLLATAREVGCLRRVCVGVEHVCMELGIGPIPSVREVLKDDRAARSLVRTLRLDMPNGKAKPGARSELAHLWWSFASEDHLSAVLGHAFRRLIQPGPEDWATYSLPGRLEWLYGPLRPPRLALKWLSRLFRGGKKTQRPGGKGRDVRPERGRV
jgi:hypothetical protein